MESKEGGREKSRDGAELSVQGLQAVYEEGWTGTNDVWAGVTDCSQYMCQYI